jgi:hypothetical protein
MNKKHLYLLCLTVVVALFAYKYLDMENGYWWLIPFGCGFFGWYFIWLILKNSKAKKNC